MPKRVFYHNAKAPACHSGGVSWNRHFRLPDTRGAPRPLAMAVCSRWWHLVWASSANSMHVDCVLPWSTWLCITSINVCLCMPRARECVAGSLLASLKPQSVITECCYHYILVLGLDIRIYLSACEIRHFLNYRRTFTQH